MRVVSSGFVTKGENRGWNLWLSRRCKSIGGSQDCHGVGLHQRREFGRLLERIFFYAKPCSRSIQANRTAIAGGVLCVPACLRFSSSYSLRQFTCRLGRTKFLRNRNPTVRYASLLSATRVRRPRLSNA